MRTSSTMVSNSVVNAASKNIPIMYFSYYSPPARGAYLVAKALNLEIELKDTNILTKEHLTPEFLKINPQHTIPTLKDGDTVIWDSHAIAGYLVHKYSMNSSLYPISPPSARALIDQKLYFDAEILFPRTFQTIYPLIFQGSTKVSRIMRSEVHRVYRLLEKFLENSPWLAGDELTIADLCCVSSISSLDYVIPILGGSTPNLRDFLNRCSKLPYYEEANQFGVDLLGKRIQESLITSYMKHTSNGQPYKNID